MAQSLLKQVLPKPLLRRLSTARSRVIQSRENRANKDRSTRDVFSEIYAKNKWGGAPGEISSGSGSIGAAANIYIENVNRFIQSNGIQSVVDLGCGDFFVASHLECADYTGVDVVQAVVDRNNTEFGSDFRRFVCMDIAGSDELPHGELCLVRQVLQHLSNEQIQSILKKLEKFRFVLITEHQPANADFKTFNRNKTHGSTTRLYHGSGVYLDQPPFDLNPRLLFEYVGDESSHEVHGRGMIRSFLLSN